MNIIILTKAINEVICNNKHATVISSISCFLFAFNFVIYMSQVNLLLRFDFIELILSTSNKHINLVSESTQRLLTPFKFCVFQKKQIAKMFDLKLY